MPETRQALQNPAHGAGTRRTRNTPDPDERTSKTQILKEVENMAKEPGKTDNPTIPVSDFVRAEVRAETGDVRTELAEQFGRQNTVLAEQFGRQDTAIAERFGKVETAIVERFDKQNAAIAERFGKMETTIAEKFDKQIRWTIGTGIAVAGLVIAVLGLWKG